MHFIHNGYVYDNNFISKLTDSLNDINAFWYNKFLNTKLNSDSIMDIIYSVEKNVSYNKNNPREINKKIPLLEDQIDLVVEFFSLFGLENKVKDILSGSDPDYKVTIDKNLHGSAVGHRGYDNFLSFDIQLNETIESCAVIAHELGHGLSNHHLKTLSLAKATNDAEKTFGANSKEFKEQQQIYRDYTDSKQIDNVDCIGEIESHITEKLFVYFLYKKGIITKEDFNIFITGQTNSLCRNLWLIMEENDIISELHNPVTEQDCINLYNKYSNSKNLNVLLDRVKFMSERKDNPNPNERKVHSKHRFRYVVGEIVATVWLKNYISSNKTEKAEMCKNFVKYLGQTDVCNLENCCELTLGKGNTFDSVVTEYINYISSKQTTI